MPVVDPDPNLRSNLFVQALYQDLQMFCQKLNADE